MSVGSRRRFWLTGCLLAAAGIALPTDRGDAQRFEYVITFDKVVVQGIEAVTETPALAHIDVSSPRVPSLSLGSKPSTSLGQDLANPSFVQEGFLVEAFWAVNTGSNNAYFKRAHFHPPDLSTGFEAQHLGNPNELHGIFIRSVDGQPFGLKSLRYRVTRNRQIPSKPISIEGFSNFNVNVLVARSFDPRAPIQTQFVSFPVGLPVDNDLRLPWWPLRVFGFELVSQLYIASSASVDFDDIVLTRSELPPVPSDRSEKDK